jgi:hypothetical protein
MCQTGRHHTSALCTIATVLCTRIVACLRNDTPYQVRDVDGSPITPAQGRAIVAERYQIPPDVRAARRTISNTRPATAEGTSASSKESQALHDDARPTGQPDPSCKP